MNQTEPSSASLRLVRFGVFEVDLESGELRKNGLKVKLQEQPFQILAMLLERPGEVVTREELRQKLWSADTFVDFDHSLNAAIKKLRQAVGDSADSPRFVETLARRGYRFIAPVDGATRHNPTEKTPRTVETLAAPEAQTVLLQGPQRAKERQANRWIGLAAALVLISVAVWFFRDRFVRRSSELPPMKVIRLTSFPGMEDAPDLSPDGRMVAFVWDGEKGDNRDIYVMLVDAGTPLRLTTDPGDDSSPAWSPDGRFVAFCRDSKGRSGIYLVPSLGGYERRLAGEDPSITSWVTLDWSPDGKLLAVSGRSSPLRPYSLYLLSVESGEKKQVTSPSSGPGDFLPAFSPDGKTLAFTRSNALTRLDIYTIPVQGGKSSRLTFDERSLQGAWTPDGREIIFSQLWSRGGLYRISVEGGSAVSLTEGGQFGFRPSVSRQGKRLAYSERIYDTDIWRFELVGSIDKVLLPTRLISSSQQEDTPQFSPDGSRIAFNSNRSGSFEIWVTDRLGQSPVQLTFFGGPYVTGTPRWSPDSKLVAFDSRPKGLADIFVVSAEGGPPHCLTEESSDDMVPSWSRDGRWVYFGSDRSGEGDWQIWKIPATGGKALQVTRRGGFEGSESFDGKSVYYSKHSDDLWRVSLMDGEESLFLKNVEFRYWTVAEQGIYFVANEDGQRHIEFIDFASRQVSRVARLERKLGTNAHRGLALSPDGRSLLVTLVERDSSDIMLVENFR